MELKAIKHLFFDLDHTLWDFEKNSALTFQKIFKIHEVEIGVAIFIRIYIPLNIQLWRLYTLRKSKFYFSL